MALLDRVHRRTEGIAGCVAIVIIENRLNQLLRGLPHVLDRCQSHPGTILPVGISGQVCGLGDNIQLTATVQFSTDVS